MLAVQSRKTTGPFRREGAQQKNRTRRRMQELSRTAAGEGAGAACDEEPGVVEVILSSCDLVGREDLGWNKSKRAITCFHVGWQISQADSGTLSIPRCPPRRPRPTAGGTR